MKKIIPTRILAYTVALLSVSWICFIAFMFVRTFVFQGTPGKDPVRMFVAGSDVHIYARNHTFVIHPSLWVTLIIAVTLVVLATKVIRPSHAKRA